MTLTSIIPSLRRSLPDPITLDRWPEHTVATPGDVVVSGVSLLRLVDVCGTPCLHTGAAVIPGTGGIPSPDLTVSVTVVRVLEVLRVDGRLVVRTDADLDHCDAVLGEARLIGRTSPAPGAAVWLREHADPASLPADVREGDLLAVPCARAVRLGVVRRHDDPDEFPVAHCGR